MQTPLRPPLHVRGICRFEASSLYRLGNIGTGNTSGICFFCSSFDQYGFSETYAAIDHAPENPLKVKAKKLDQQAQKLDVSHSCEYLVAVFLSKSFLHNGSPFKILRHSASLMVLHQRQSFWI